MPVGYNLSIEQTGVWGRAVETLIGITDTIDTYMYTYFLVFLLIASGLYFSVRTKFIQFRGFKDMIKNLTEKKHVPGKKTVSSFQALMVSTASRVGTGNIAGVATAIATGGPGAVFWMWVMASISAASAFIESTLAQIWKVRGEGGEFRGGPAYYIQQALHSKVWGNVFAVSLILCFGLGFNGLQTYNMSSSLAAYIPNYFDTGAPIALGIVLAVIVAFILFGGTRIISFLTSIIVPIMAIGYILLALILIGTALVVFLCAKNRGRLTIGGKTLQLFPDGFNSLLFYFICVLWAIVLIACLLFGSGFAYYAMFAAIAVELIGAVYYTFQLK